MLMEEEYSIQNSVCGDPGLAHYYKTRVDALEMIILKKTHHLARLAAQRNTLNTQGLKRILCNCSSS